MLIRPCNSGIYIDFQQLTGNLGLESHRLPQTFRLLPVKSGAGLRAFNLVRSGFITLHDGGNLPSSSLVGGGS
jgi:hypothetical protein